MRRKGFTLLEALVTMALMLIVVGIGGDLIKRYSEQMRFAASREDSFNAVQVALSQTTAELREAFNLTTPAPGASASVLAYQIYDPALTWLPGSPTGTAPPTTIVMSEPLPASGCLNVSVFVTADHRLVRSLSAAPSRALPTVNSTLAYGVSSMNCTSWVTGLTQIQLRFIDNKPVVQHCMRIIQ